MAHRPNRVMKQSALIANLIQQPRSARRRTTPHLILHFHNSEFRRHNAQHNETDYHRKSIQTLTQTCTSHAIYTESPGNGQKKSVCLFLRFCLQSVSRVELVELAFT